VVIYYLAIYYLAIYYLRFLFTTDYTDFLIDISVYPVVLCFKFINLCNLW